MKHYNLYQNVNCIENGITTYIDCKYNCCINNNSGRCLDCNVIEDEYHFMFICPKYKKARDMLWNKIDYLYRQYQIEIDLHTILFPPIINKTF